MVSAELSHNPFLLETEALFNGHTPQVNSAIYKYEHKALVDWVNEVPRIYHDEMNGYDFDLYFSGTDADFACVRNAFAAANVSQDSVRIIRKGSLSGPSEKMSQVLALLGWLKENPNPHFDFEALFEDNPSLLDASFSLLILNGEVDRSSRARIVLEQVSDVSELAGSDLTSTPILVYISPKTEHRVARDVQSLLARHDVLAEQLFFIIHKSLKRQQIVRVLSDLGANNPQVVGSIDDKSIIDYTEGHLVTEYVRNAITILDGEARRIKEELREIAKRDERSSALKGERINVLDDEANRLGYAADALSQLSTLDAPREFELAKTNLRSVIYEWKSRKRRIENDYEAQMAAEDIQRVMRQALDDFSAALADASREMRRKTDEELARIYTSANVDTSFRPYESPLSLPTMPAIPNLGRALLALKETAVADKKYDIFNLFGSALAPEEEKTEMTVYYLDRWRTKVLELIEPVMTQLEDAYVRIIKSYQEWMVEAYQAHIADLINVRHTKKSQMIVMLTDDEKLMRTDSDWLSSFEDRLQEIKRG